MTKTYTALTVGKLIALLDEMPDGDLLFDISTRTGSYRGYYEHVFIEPARGEPTTAGELKAALTRKLGTTMHGYKGGDYTFSADSVVLYAYEDSTGPMLLGFETHEPVVAAEPGWL